MATKGWRIGETAERTTSTTQETDSDDEGGVEYVSHAGLIKKRGLSKPSFQPTQPCP